MHSIDDTAVWILALSWMLAFGGAIGSFMNVVVYRCPRHRSIVHPGSRCPTCGHDIRPWDNVPVLAWLWLRGRCRDCRSPISIRYPTIEFVVALLFASLGWIEVLSEGGGVAVAALAPQVDGPWLFSWRCGLWAFHLLMLCTLITAGLIRFDALGVPRRIWYPALVVGLFAPTLWPWLLPSTRRGDSPRVPFEYAADTLVVVAIVLLLAWLATFRKSHLKAWVPQAVESPIALVVVLSLFLGPRAGVIITVASMVVSAVASQLHARHFPEQLVAAAIAWTWIAIWPWLCHTCPLLGPAANNPPIALLVTGGAIMIGLLILGRRSTDSVVP